MTNPPQNPFSGNPRNGIKGDRGIPVWLIMLFLVPLFSIPFLKKTKPKEEPSGIESPAPELSFKDRNGKKATLSDFRGKTVLINFWASWCGPCMDEMPDLVDLDKELGAEKFAVLALNVEDNPAAAYQVLASTLPKLTFFEIPDSQLQPYEVRSIPASYLIDAKGLLRRFYLGPRPWTSSEMLFEFRRIIALYSDEGSGKNPPESH